MKNNVIRGITTLLTIILTASLGRITFNGHTETWYDLPMDRVIQEADAMIGVSDMYYIREDGVKMYGPWVIVASHPSVPRYSFVDTSLGLGIVLDRHEMPDKNLYDIATDWKE
ncbi:MAG: hypothetical protein IIY21_16290 [Clostridiales bacterium]|nr:hypothetical protein [Clostridiales bacterium]MBQ1570123.1 hypothetical protein [Clostridiales bacterium]